MQTMQFCRWQPSCTMTLSMSTLLIIFTLLPSLHIAPNTLRLMLHLSLHAPRHQSSFSKVHPHNIFSSFLSSSLVDDVIHWCFMRFLSPKHAFPEVRHVYCYPRSHSTAMILKASRCCDLCSSLSHIVQVLQMLIAFKCKAIGQAEDPLFDSPQGCAWPDHAAGSDCALAAYLHALIHKVVMLGIWLRLYPKPGCQLHIHHLPVTEKRKCAESQNACSNAAGFTQLFLLAQRGCAAPALLARAAQLQFDRPPCGSSEF